MPQHHGHPSTDAVLELLADRRRRAALRHLSTSDGEVDLDDVIGALAPDDPTDLRVALHHHHLPRLDDAGVVTYDAAAGTVEYHPDRRVESLLAFVAEELEATE